MAESNGAVQVSEKKKKVSSIEKSVEDLEKEITCAICHVHYTDPKVLPCCHYYCKECIKKISQYTLTKTSKPFSCPECRKTTTLPQGGVDNLPTAFFINRMKSIHASMEQVHGKVEAKCENCLQGKAEAFCRQCAMFICAECVQQHKKMRILAGHKTTSLDELKKGGIENILPEPVLQPCEVHKEPLKVYCFDCNHLICRDCSIKDHLGHNYEFITVAAPQKKGKLIQQLDPLKRASTNLSLAIKTIKATVSEIEKQKESVDKSIRTSFAKLRDIIDAREKELLKETEMKVKDKVKSLSIQEKDLSISRAVVQSVIDYTEQCVEHSADDEVMSMHTEIQSRIDKEMKEFKSKDLEPTENADIGVAIGLINDLEQLCQTDVKIVCDYSVIASEKEVRTEVNKASELQVTIKLPNGNFIGKKQAVTCYLKSLVNNSVVKCETVSLFRRGRYRVTYTPIVRGRHNLTVAVNDHEIATISVFVTIPPAKMKTAVRAIESPRDIAMMMSGEVVAACETEIVKLDARKRKNLFLAKANEKFVGITVDKTNDNVYAVNYINSCNEILKLNPDLTFVHSTKINEKNGTSNLTGIEIIGDEVIVFDYHFKRLKVFTKGLLFVRTVNVPNNATIRDVSSDKDGNLYVSDGSYGVVRVLSKAGDVLRSLGNGTSPYGVCVSGEYVYVGNGANYTISVYKADTGESVTTISENGSGPNATKSPRGLCVDADGFLYVCDKGNNRIQVF